jgi:hypothetical protein
MDSPEHFETQSSFAAGDLTGFKIQSRFILDRVLGNLLQGGPRLVMNRSYSLATWIPPRAMLVPPIQRPLLHL